MLHDRGKIDTLSMIFKPFKCYLTFFVAPISVDNVDLVKLWSNIVRHLIRIQSFDNKNFLYSSLRTRKVSKVSISLLDFEESIIIAGYIHFFDH